MCSHSYKVLNRQVRSLKVIVQLSPRDAVYTVQEHDGVDGMNAKFYVQSYLSIILKFCYAEMKTFCRYS